MGRTVLIAKVGKAVKTALVSSSLPAWLKKEEIRTHNQPLLAWKCLGVNQDRYPYTTSIEFSSLHNGATWVMANVYAPCTPAGKRNFLLWFKRIQMPDTIDWLVVGDFNLYRNPDDRNKPTADYADTLKD